MIVSILFMPGSEWSGRLAQVMLNDAGVLEAARVLQLLPEGTTLRRIDMVDSGASPESLRAFAAAAAKVSRRVGLTELHFERNSLVRK